MQLPPPSKSPRRRETDDAATDHGEIEHAPSLEMVNYPFQSSGRLRDRSYEAGCARITHRGSFLLVCGPAAECPFRRRTEHRCLSWRKA